MACKVSSMSLNVLTKQATQQATFFFNSSDNFRRQLLSHPKKLHPGLAFFPETQLTPTHFFINALLALFTYSTNTPQHSKSTRPSPLEKANLQEAASCSPRASSLGWEGFPPHKRSHKAPKEADRWGEPSEETSWRR